MRSDIKMTGEIMNDRQWAPAASQQTVDDTQCWQALAQAHDFCRQARDAALTVDAHGRITTYSPAAAALLGRGAEDLSGDDLSLWIKQLPFRPDTPGYNLAYAVFHGARGLWHRYTVVSPGGQSIPLDVALSSVMMNGVRSIQLTLKAAAASGQQAHCH